MQKMIRELRERRFWRVLIAYPSVTFVLLQAVEFFINHYGLDERWLTATILGAIILLPAAIIWNWRHGEEGEQPFVRSERIFYLFSLVITAGLVSWYWQATPVQVRGQPSKQIDTPVIAVLPFELKNKPGDLQYLADGIAENLINWLSSIPGVKVVSSTASFRQRGKAGEPKALADSLGADQVVIGSLEVVNGQLESSVSLVDARDESQLWGERFSAAMDDQISLERSIVNSLQKKFLTDEANTSLRVSVGTDDSLAYQAYQRGHFLIQSTDSARVQEGLEELRRAIRADPAFGWPYADIADALSQMLFYGESGDLGLLGEARSAAYSAVALAPRLPEAHIALAAVHQYIDFDWQAAEQAYETAISLTPQSPAPFHRYADFLWVTLRFDRALEMAMRAVESDPLDGSSMHAVGISYLFAGRFTEAAEAFGEWNRFYPENRWALTKHAVALALGGQCEQSETQAERVMEMTGNKPSILMLSWLAWSYHVCKNQSKYQQAKQRLQALADEDPESLDPGLIYYFALENRGDLAVALLRRLVDQGSPVLMFAQVLVPDYLGWPDITRGEAGAAYLELIRQLNFPPSELLP